MATLSYFIDDSHPSRSGLFTISLVLQHKGKSARFATDMKVRSSEFSDGRVVNHPQAELYNRRLFEKIAVFYGMLDSIPDKDTYDVQTLKKKIESLDRVRGNTPISVIGEQYLAELTLEHRDSYAQMISRSLRRFIECQGDLPLRDIDQDVIRAFDHTISHSGISVAYRGILLSHIKVLINRAIVDRYVSYQTHPFLGTKIGHSPFRDSAVSTRTLISIIDHAPLCNRSRLAKDIFLLSFYMGGMNLADIVRSDFRSDMVRYVRKKADRAGFTVTIPICREAREIADRYITSEGTLDFGYHFSYNNLLHFVRKGLLTLEREASLTEHVSFYSARKTFAQIALDLDYPDVLVDATLGHSPSARGVISYYSHVKAKKIGDMIEKVVCYVKTGVI